LFEDVPEFAPEGIPERPMIPHTSGTLGIQQIRGKNIQTERKYLGQSQEEFAKKLDITLDYLRRIERGGATLRINKLSLIAKRLGRTIADLERP
jgi:ribosome-binding protein aMBF1 (putative translation factor)